MAVKVANTPVSWGVHWAVDPRNVSWPVVLDGLAHAGYQWIELGPIGYLPEQPAQLRRELDRRGLKVTATYVHEPLADPSKRERILGLTRRGCHLLRELGAPYLVVIDQREPERLATAGRSDAAQRCSDAHFDALMEGILDVAQVAREEGVTPVLHPHVAGYIEFRDEIDRALAALDPAAISLCLDTGHTAYAGIDPAELIRAYAGRLEYIHFKDVSAAVLERVLADELGFHEAMLEGIFCPVGEGIVDFRSVAAELDAADYQGFACVEQDHEPRDPERVTKAAAGARRSLEFLREQGIAESAETVNR